MIDAAVPEKVEKLVRDLLDERFGTQFVFDPIKVIPRIDHDGDEYLHIYIVFDGDQKLLDPDWTLQLYELISPQLLEMGVLNSPSKSFVEKSDWERVYADRHRESA